jgi:hypothetical protein
MSKELRKTMGNRVQRIKKKNKEQEKLAGLTSDVPMLV